MTAARSRSFHSSWLRWVIASSAVVCACGTPGSPTVAPRPVISRTEPIRIANALLDEMRRGALPAGVDRAVADLEAVVANEGTGSRGLEARRLASRLLHARARITRDPADRERAVASLDALGQERGAIGCAARVSSADLLANAGDVDAARTRYLQYERSCGTEPDLAHVHATLALLDPATARAATSANRTSRYRRIVIDPGHGGSDPGAVSATGLSESSVTLDVSRRLAERLATQTGADVVLTRDRDVYVPLEDRAVRANRAGADLFVSIHCNSSENPLSHGVSTYVLDATDDRVAARVARRENGAVESDPLADPEVFRILADLRLIGSSSRSTQIANAIQHSMLDTLRANYDNVADLGVHTARFHVLVGARMPAVLVELSFLSNDREAARLADDHYRDAVADAIAAALGHP